MPSVYTAEPGDLAKSSSTPVVLGVIGGALALAMVIVCSCWQCLACAKLTVQGDCDIIYMPYTGCVRCKAAYECHW